MKEARLTTRFALPPVSLGSVAAAALVLFVALVALDRVVEFGLKQLLLHSKYRYMEVYEPAPPARYLVIGNSRAGVHFPHSAKLGGEFFNLGNGGMGVAFAAALTADYVDIHGPPKTVIIEMSFVADPRSGEAAAGLARVFSQRARAIGRNVTPFQKAAEHVFHLVRFNHQTLLNALVGLVWERGQRAVNTRVNDATIAHIEHMAPFTEAPVAANVAQVVNLIAELRRRNVSVICVLSPLLPQMREKISNFDNYVAALRSLAVSNGALFVNDAAAISNRDLFADSAHLNVEGVKKFHQLFFAQLAQQKP